VVPFCIGGDIFSLREIKTLFPKEEVFFLIGDSVGLLFGEGSDYRILLDRGGDFFPPRILGAFFLPVNCVCGACKGGGFFFLRES